MILNIGSPLLIGFVFEIRGADEGIDEGKGEGKGEGIVEGKVD